MRKRIVALLLMVIVISVLTAPVCAHSYRRAKSDNPLRYAAYLVYPIGIAGEYLITRPIHWLVSRKGFCKIFGHNPKPDDIYFEW